METGPGFKVIAGLIIVLSIFFGFSEVQSNRESSLENLSNTFTTSTQSSHAEPSKNSNISYYYRMDGSKDIINEYSGLNRSSSLKGSSLRLDGSRMRIEANKEINSTMSTGNLTIMFWINHSQTGGGWTTVFSWTAKNATGHTRSARTEMANSNRSIYTRWIGENNDCGNRNGAFWARSRDMNMPPFNWTLYTVTYDGETVKEYSNGVLQEQSSPGCSMGDLASDLYMRDGVRPAVKDLRLYNRTLEPEEVEDVAQGKEISNDELHLHVKLDEGVAGCNVTYSRPCLEDSSSSSTDVFPESFSNNQGSEGWEENLPSLKNSEGVLGTQGAEFSQSDSLEINDTSENFTVSMWARFGSPGNYGLLSNISEHENVFSEENDWRGDVEDLGEQDGFKDVRLANASSEDNWEDIFTGSFDQEDFPGFGGPENYLYLSYWSKSNSLPSWEDSGRSSYNWVKDPEPNESEYQLYVLRSDGVEPDRKEYFRMYYSRGDDSSYGYFADPKVYLEKPLVKLSKTNITVHSGNYSSFKTGLSTEQIQHWNHYTFRKKGPELTIFVNDRKIGTTDAENFSINQISYRHPFGSYLDRKYSVDEVRVHNRSLTDAEVKNII